MRRSALALPIVFLLVGCQDTTAPEDMPAAQQNSRFQSPPLIATPSNLTSAFDPSPVTIICTASVPPRCEVKVKPPK